MEAYNDPRSKSNTVLCTFHYFTKKKNQKKNLIVCKCKSVCIIFAFVLEVSKFFMRKKKKKSNN